MTTVNQILKEKGSEFFSIGPDQVVYEALQLMAEKDIGALPVIDKEGKMVGMFPEGRLNLSRQFMLPVRSGAFLAAIKSGAWILPCYIHGSPFASEPWSPLTMRARVIVRFGPIVDPVEADQATVALVEMSGWSQFVVEDCQMHEWCLIRDIGTVPTRRLECEMIGPYQPLIGFFPTPETVHAYNVTRLENQRPR